MQIFAISGLVNGIIAGALGFLVILKNWRDRSNQLYLLMTGSLTLWAICYWLWLRTTDYDTALTLVRLLSIGSLFIPIFFFHWVILLLRSKNIAHRMNNAILLFSYVIGITTLFFSDSQYFINNLQSKSIFILWPNSGVVYDVYFSYLYLGLVTYTMYLLLRSYRIVRNLQDRGQILFILFGAILGFGGGLTNFPLWFGVSMLPYGNFLVAAFPFFLGYSIFKYKLFNARTIATEISVFFLAVISFVDMSLSSTLLEFIIKGIAAIAISVFGYMVIRSVYREVTQREKIELLAGDLEAANVRLKDLDRQKSEFVSFATHQIRAPLTAMKGYASLLLEGDMGNLEPVSKEGVKRIYESTNTLVNIVNDYLNVSRIELGSMKYAFEQVDMNELVKEVMAEIKPNMDKSGLQFDFSTSDNTRNYRIVADRDKLKQVIENLIDNSIKYTPKGSVHISLAYDNDKNKIVFKISDTGVGIAPEVLPKLFQKFSRADDASKTNIKGTGLGLYVAKQMVEAHHGTIRAESGGEGKGSTFIVELNPAPKN